MTAVVATIKSYLKEYHKRIAGLEAEKFDLEYEVARKDYEVPFCFLYLIKILSQ